jgi:hypothetical protein
MARQGVCAGRSLSCLRPQQSIASDRLFRLGLRKLTALEDLVDQ